MLTLDPLCPAEEAHPAEAPEFDPVPLCVDLDGTLVKSDTLQDSTVLLLRHQPLKLIASLRMLLRGKARFKQEIARQMPLDVSRLPWNHAVLRYIRKEHASGRIIVLATGADLALAERVAVHLSCIDRLVASDGHLNLTGSRKLAVLQQLFPVFDYIGNSTSDLPLLAQARLAIVANPSHALSHRLRRRAIPVEARLIDCQSPVRSSMAALRLHQWAKNLLLLLPLLLSHQLNLRSVVPAMLAFCSFGCAASACYVLNDLLDLENDRRHPHKRLRTFAAGDRTVASGILLGLTLLGLCTVFLLWLPAAFVGWIAAYLALTTLYSLLLKQIVVIDVLLLSCLYTLRLYAGGAATGTVISPWLACFATFFFLSLAMLKRYNELETLRQQGMHHTPGRGYRVADIDLIRTSGTICGYSALVVFALYIQYPVSVALYPHAALLWLILPLLLFWLQRIWLLAARGEMDEDPVLFALRDHISLLLGAAIAMLAWTAAR